MMELNAVFQFEWTTNLLRRILRMIFKSFAFNFLLFSSDVMYWSKSLQTNLHFQRLLTSNLIRMLSVMWLNPWFLKMSSNILIFVLIQVLPNMRSMGKWPSKPQGGDLLEWPSAPTLHLGDIEIKIYWASPLQVMRTMGQQLYRVAFKITFDNSYYLVPILSSNVSAIPIGQTGLEMGWFPLGNGVCLIMKKAPSDSLIWQLKKRELLPWDTWPLAVPTLWI